MESHETILALISKLSFFSIFSDEEKKTLSKLKSHILSFHHNEHIIHQGDFDASLYVLLKGKVYINKNERPNLRLSNLKPGDVFGEIAFVKQIPRSANAFAEADSIVLKIDGEIFNQLSAEIQNKFRAKFMDILIDRLEELNRRYVRDAQQQGKPILRTKG